MGMGDEIIAIGHAKAAATIAGQPVVICDKDWKPRWHELWKGCDWIHDITRRRPHPSLVKIRNGPGCRPYLKSICPVLGSTFNHDYKVGMYRPELRLSQHELYKAVELAGHTIIEPNTDPRSCQNKRIPWRVWQDLVKNVDRKWLQIVYDRTMPVLEGVKTVRVTSMRQSAAVVQLSEGVVSYEGGMIHIAAAVCRPAVTVCTGFTPVDVITYPDHLVIHPNNHNGCGKWGHCKDCFMFAQSLNWTDVAAGVEKMQLAYDNYWKSMLAHTS